MYLACDVCSSVWSVLDDEEAEKLLVQHKHWINHPRMCPQCGGTVVVTTVALVGYLRAQGVAVPELTASEAFSALCGLGLPEQIGHEPEVVEALLLAHRVTGVEVAKSPSGRTLLKSLTLANGVTIHLISNVSGAGVLKIVRRTDESDRVEIQPDPSPTDVHGVADPGDD